MKHIFQVVKPQCSHHWWAFPRAGLSLWSSSSCFVAWTNSSWICHWEKHSSRPHFEEYWPKELDGRAGLNLEHFPTLSAFIPTTTRWRKILKKPSRSLTFTENFWGTYSVPGTLHTSLFYLHLNFWNKTSISIAGEEIVFNVRVISCKISHYLHVAESDFSCLPSCWVVVLTRREPL